MARQAIYPDPFKKFACELGVARRPQEQKHPLRHRWESRVIQWLEPPTAGVGTSSGTPVSTPRNFLSGSPIRIPSDPMENSRSVDSCAPVRFFITEIALHT